jgi:hypothetical protein
MRELNSWQGSWFGNIWAGNPGGGDRRWEPARRQSCCLLRYSTCWHAWTLHSMLSLLLYSPSTSLSNYVLAIYVHQLLQEALPPDPSLNQKLFPWENYFSHVMYFFFHLGCRKLSSHLLNLNPRWYMFSILLYWPTASVFQI